MPEWDDEEEIAPDAHELVQELYGIWDSLKQNKMLEAWHDAQQIREEALDLFCHGIVDLKTRAQTGGNLINLTCNRPIQTLETWVTKSVKEGKISLEEGKEFLSNYRSGLYGYTYLE